MGFQFSKIKSNSIAGIFLHILAAGILFVVIAVLYFYVYLPHYTNHGETITVPNIEGKSLEQIEKELTDRSLRYEISDSSYSEKHDPMTVIKQYPHAGAKVKEGRKIFISLNASSPPTVPVPNLIDGSVVNAEAVLRSNQLKRGRIEIVPGPFFNVVKEIKYQGSVIQPMTRVPKGSVIDLVVMKGGDDPTMPDLIGMEFEDARALILGYNLSMGNTHLEGDTLQKKPVILEQKPLPGENMKVGDPVDLWIGAPGTVVSEDESETFFQDNDESNP